MAEHGHGHGHADLTPGGAHPHHILSQGKLATVFAALVFLMALTIGAAFYAPENIRSNTMMMNLIAMGIAIIKATLVVTFFMGVKMSTRLTKIFAIGGFVWFFTLFIMMADYMTRPMEPVRGWENVSDSALPREKVEPTKTSH
ncbi:cytochrome C oxidase subunit IV family protein [Kamptonema cortianum]|nr:cytochrome C oxidase subunit IV family protein [Geitlerinema splendidum]MDK3162424.1 cytochrome C oxidase subunit IV family protein [Kamptonema cortianum]